MVDRLRLQPEHRPGGRKDEAVDAQRFLAVHRYPEIFPARVLLQPVAVIVRHQHQQRVAGAETIIAVLVAQPPGSADRVLKHGERRLAALAPIPVVGFVIADLIAGAGRHGMQPVAPARQRNRPHRPGRCQSNPAAQNYPRKHNRSLVGSSNIGIIHPENTRRPAIEENGHREEGRLDFMALCRMSAATGALSLSNPPLSPID